MRALEPARTTMREHAQAGTARRSGQAQASSGTTTLSSDVQTAQEFNYGEGFPFFFFFAHVRCGFRR